MKKGLVNIIIVGLFLFSGLVISYNIAMPSNQESGDSKVNTFKTKQDCKTFADEVVNLVVSGEINKAINKVEPYWLFEEKEWANFEKTTFEQWKEQGIVSKRYGSPIGFEFIKEESAKEIVVRFIYIVKHKRHITRWQFVFYKPEKEWLLNSFIWDDKINELF